MNIYSNQISKLLAEEEDKEAKDTLLISIYHPVKNKIRREVKKELKARTQTILRRQKKSTIKPSRK